MEGICKLATHKQLASREKFKAGEGLTRVGRGDATEVPIQAAALLVQEANELGWGYISVTC